jgi:hypothetical protein
LEAARKPSAAAAPLLRNARTVEARFALAAAASAAGIHSAITAMTTMWRIPGDIARVQCEGIRTPLNNSVVILTGFIGTSFAVWTDQATSSVSHSAPTAKELSTWTGIAAHLSGLAARRAQGSILRAPGRRRRGRRARSIRTVHAERFQHRTGSRVGRASRTDSSMFAICSL